MKGVCQSSIVLQRSDFPLPHLLMSPLDSSVIRGHAAPSKDFLPTDHRTTKNLPSSSSSFIIEPTFRTISGHHLQR